MRLLPLIIIGSMCIPAAGIAALPFVPADKSVLAIIGVAAVEGLSVCVLRWAFKTAASRVRGDLETGSLQFLPECPVCGGRITILSKSSARCDHCRFSFGPQP